MNAHDWTKTMAIALATAGAVLALAWPRAAVATDEAQVAVLAKVPEAAVSIGTCEVTITCATPALAKPGTPTFELRVVNRGEEPARITVPLVASKLPRTSRLARMRPVPKTVWTKDLVVTVAAGATVKLPVEPGVALAAGESLRLGAKRGGELANLAAAHVVVPEERRRLGG